MPRRRCYHNTIITIIISPNMPTVFCNSLIWKGHCNPETRKKKFSPRVA